MKILKISLNNRDYNRITKLSEKYELDDNSLGGILLSALEGLDDDWDRGGYCDYD